MTLSKTKGKNMNISNCCSEPLLIETDICSKCKEHCKAVDAHEAEKQKAKR